MDFDKAERLGLTGPVYRDPDNQAAAERGILGIERSVTANALYAMAKARRWRQFIMPAPVSAGYEVWDGCPPNCPGYYPVPTLDAAIQKVKALAARPPGARPVAY